MPLTADVLVCPAHGARSLCCKALSWANISSIGAEKAGNPMLPPLSEKDFVYANGHGREKYRGQPLQPLLHGARETKRPIHTNFA